MPITSTDLYALALDGGGTGCRAVLIAPDGSRVGSGQAGPANVNSDRQGALASILQASDQALAGSGVRPSRIAALLGLAGAEMSGAADWLVPLLPFRRVSVVQDAVTATAGALAGADGIVAAIGTGSVFARHWRGQHLVIGGRGPILGDQASGNWLGRQLLSRALEAADGLRPTTPLLDDLLRQFGGINGIVTFAATATAADFAAHARVLADNDDDPAAVEVLALADQFVIAHIERLQPSGSLPVFFTGGLGAIFAARLADRWSIQPAKGSPLDGAILMARDLATKAD